MLKEDSCFSGEKCVVPAAGPDLHLPLPTANSSEDSWDAFFSQRGFLGARSNNTLGRQLSSYLTYPLTIAHMLPMLERPCASGGARSGLAERTSLIVDIVGARTEALAPLWVWRELRVAAGRGIAVRAFGPQVTSRPDACEKVDGGISVGYYPGLYHEADSTVREAADIAVVCCPGLGHPAHCDGWEPTFRWLLRGRAAPRAVALTAFDAADLESDLSALQRWGLSDAQTLGKFARLAPRVNPWRGLGFDVAPPIDAPTDRPRLVPGGDNRFVQRNWAVHAFVRNDTPSS
jgi:hypothetical protein